ncbi:uncharacterized protein LOC110691187 [Chenopodium quinoa]|uniref:uncharacterized protein LOC110691187 n=1 Tax=Chenopodium quinoa TaxID=63459 RepID=UPI000B78E8C0|nr:uncharacterized protein LOC110691187 [Chenopodium quinoa]
MFSFTSLGVKKDKELAQRHHGIYTFRVQGQVYHYVNDIHRNDEKPRYLLLYLYDTDVEYRHRVSIFKNLDPRVIGQLVRLMELNPYVQFFRSLKDVNIVDTSLIIIRSNLGEDQHTHNAPTSSQVVAIWLEDAGTSGPLQRNIVVRAHSGVNHCIQHYYGCYDPLRYPILFPYCQTGWHRQIYRFKTKHQKRQECHTFPINEVLVQTVDDLLEVEEQDFIRRNQDTITAELYQGILDSLNTSVLHGSNIERGFILPPSFIGGPRDMRRRYLDAMALVQHYGKPDIFLPMTCNPSWPEITDELLPHKEGQNRPDLIALVFHAKLTELKKDIVQKKLFGEVATYVYVIGFQKEELPPHTFSSF